MAEKNTKRNLMGHIFFDKAGRKPSYRGFFGNQGERERRG
jgi:hypothetical protein